MKRRTLRDLAVCMHATRARADAATEPNSALVIRSLSFNMLGNVVATARYATEAGTRHVPGVAWRPHDAAPTGAARDPTTTGRRHMHNNGAVPPNQDADARMTAPAEAPRLVADAVLDARHLTCPLPILKAKKRLSALAVGQTLEVLATDPNTLDDARQFAKARGHEIVATETVGDVITIVFKRGA